MKWDRFGLLGGALLVVCAATAACDDSADAPEGGAGAAGQRGATDGGSGGAPVTCDCGDDPDFVHVPLDCACAAGLCTTIAQDLQTDYAYQLGLPYVVLRGTCADGYQVLSYREACENGSVRTYDADGKLVYSSYGPYGGSPPVCERRIDSGFGDFGVGAENPAKDCHFCIITHEGDGGAGGGGSGVSCYGDDITKYEPCEP